MATPEPTRLSTDRLLRLAGSAVSKVDLLGPRGTTLCTMDEIEAMALIIAASGVLPGQPTDPERRPLYPHTEKETP